jgi:hypothetical protein
MSSLSAPNGALNITVPEADRLRQRMEGFSVWKAALWFFPHIEQTFAISTVSGPTGSERVPVDQLGNRNDPLYLHFRFSGEPETEAHNCAMWRDRFARYGEFTTLMMLKAELRQ